MSEFRKNFQTALTKTTHCIISNYEIAKILKVIDFIRDKKYLIFIKSMTFTVAMAL